MADSPTCTPLRPSSPPPPPADGIMSKDNIPMKNCSDNETEHDTLALIPYEATPQDVVDSSALRDAGTSSEGGGDEGPRDTVEFPGGPTDRSILKSFKDHIAYTIWTGAVEDDRGPLKCINHWSKLNDWDLSQECEPVRRRVEQSGLMNLAKFSYRYIDRSLVSAFIERWQPETNTFHLPFGEMTITLDDVHQILGIPVQGVCVYSDVGGAGIGYEACISLLQRGLGVSEAAASKEIEKVFSVKLSWIKEVCKGAPEDAPQARIDECARGYLLYLLGCTLFPDKTGNKISVYYLTSLMDLDVVGATAWGMGILAHMYRQMGLASRIGVRQISGCLTLLQAWIYEHFIIGKALRDVSYDEQMPRMRRWQIQVNPGDLHSAQVAMREHLDDLAYTDVCWDPYKDRRVTHSLHEVAYFSGVLISYDIAEPYYPDRVLRQFGRVQTIPKNPMKAMRDERGNTGARYKVVYDISKWIQENWQNHVLAEASRSKPVNDPWECTTDYMEWFSKITHRRVQNPTNRKVPMRKSLVDVQADKMKVEISKALKLLRTSLRSGADQNVNDVLLRDREAYDILKALMKSSDAEKRVEEENRVQEEEACEEVEEQGSIRKKAKVTTSKSKKTTSKSKGVTRC